MELIPPQPGQLYPYPTGLCWKAREEVFYYLERNSNTLVRMDSRGKTLQLIPRPSPPLQVDVLDLGMTVDPENGSIWIAGAGPDDHQITRALQITPGGRLTGLEIALDHLPLHLLTGITRDGPDLIVVGRGRPEESFRLQLFHPIPPPAALTCRAQGEKVLLSFQPGGSYDQVVVLRNGEEIAVLPGSASEYQDTPPARDQYLVYSVYGRVEGGGGNTAYCEIPPLPNGFIRGDADGSGELLINDAIWILSYLFLSGPEPPCDDAADVDDDGEIIISDIIRLLFHLFLEGGDLPAPYPLPGEDPTADFLTCS
jgi:hypothetical protein